MYAALSLPESIEQCALVSKQEADPCKISGHCTNVWDDREDVWNIVEGVGEDEGKFKYELESKQRTTFRSCLRKSSVDFNSVVAHLIETQKKE